MKSLNGLILSFLFFIGLSLGALPVTGQITHYGVGVTATDGTTIETNDDQYYTSSLGVTLKTGIEVDKNLQLLPKLSVFLPEKEERTNGEANTMLTDLSISLNKINNPRDLIRTYLFGGLNFSGWYVQDKNTGVVGEVDFEKFGLDIGLNAGAGLCFNIKHDTELFLEAGYLKYITSEYGQIMGTVGINFLTD